MSFQKITITKKKFDEYLQNINSINELSLVLGGNDENVMSNEVQKIDSVHDFGSTRGNSLATDGVTKIRDYPNAYAYNPMTLYFIQKYSFPIVPANNWCSSIQPIPIQLFSNFSYPGVAPLQRAVNDVEDYCFLLAIKNSLTTGEKTSANFSYQSYEPKKVDTLKPIKQQLANFFLNYTDTTDTTGTGKINFLVDTPGDLTKVLKSTKSVDNFAYIFLQESAHDSAKGKPTTLVPSVIDDAYMGNGFCEVFGLPPRTYTSGIIGTGLFESNYTITFNGMNLTSDKQSFLTNVTYVKPDVSSQSFPCILNSLIHPTNVPQITKAVGTIIKGNDLKLQPEEMVDLRSNLVDKYYTDFGNNLQYNYLQDNQNLLDFNFTKKRAGDGLQARVCQLVNNGDGISCWKKYNPENLGASGSDIQGGLDTRSVYTIKNLILVTIDRVLFSYCVKNDIPAIYSGNKCFLFFNPKIGNIESGGTIIEKPLFEQIKKEINVENKKKINREIIKQKGGDDITSPEDIFTEIPFNLFKILPKLLNSFKGDNRKTGIIDVIISELKEITDNTLKTVYANDKICLYTNDDVVYYGKPEFNGLNVLAANYLIWLYGDRGVSENARISVYLDRDNNFRFNYNNNNYDLLFSKADIYSLINIKGYLTRNSLEKLITDDELMTDYLNTFLDVTHTSGGGNDTDLIEDQPSKVPLLDMYYDLFFIKDITLDESKLVSNNLLSLISYFNLFARYETMLCCDNEEYYQSFPNAYDVEVTKKLGTYIMFKTLLDDFQEKKDKICYSLLEYFINTADVDKNYFAISDDLESLIYYLFCDYKILEISANNRITELIANGQIDTNSQIFKNTASYFIEDLYPKVSQKVTEIEEYLTGVNTDQTNADYIKKYLSMYGFMNMVNNFEDIINPPIQQDNLTSSSTAEITKQDEKESDEKESDEEESDDNLGKGLSKYDLMKQTNQNKKLAEQERLKAEQLKKIKQGVLKMKTGFKPINTFQPINTFASANTLAVRGGLHSKKHNKKGRKRITKKLNKKNKTRNHKTRKNKRRNRKTRKH